MLAGLILLAGPVCFMIWAGTMYAVGLSPNAKLQFGTLIAAGALTIAVGVAAIARSGK